MGSKPSIPGATEYLFFQITFFGTKNHQKNWTVSLQFNSPIIFIPLYLKRYFSLISVASLNIYSKQLSNCDSSVGLEILKNYW